MKELDFCSWDFNHSIFTLQPCETGLAVVAKSIYCGGGESSQSRQKELKHKCSFLWKFQTKLMAQKWNIKTQGGMHSCSEQLRFWSVYLASENCFDCSYSKSRLRKMVIYTFFNKCTSLIDFNWCHFSNWTPSGPT